jgi:hypothetical protein
MPTITSARDIGGICGSTDSTDLGGISKLVQPVITMLAAISSLMFMLTPGFKVVCCLCGFHFADVVCGVAYAMPILAHHAQQQVVDHYLFLHIKSFVQAQISHTSTLPIHNTAPIVAMIKPANRVNAHTSSITVRDLVLVSHRIMKQPKPTAAVINPAQNIVKAIMSFPFLDGI